ncbi:MAG TPA: cytochrome d ubiquinol oxidase subunit II, partial [Alteraurantiacibacter sp.]
LAYAIILPATYPLIIAMLLGLVFRGVAFEFRWRDPGHRAFWDLAFSGGSLVAALSQGMILGAILQGVVVEDRAYAGSWFDWFTPYTLLTGIGVAAGYALLGMTWLVWKTEGETQARAYRLAFRAAIATLALLVAVSLYTPALDAGYFDRWFTMPNFIFASQVPLLTAIIAGALFYTLKKRREAAPFFLALAIFLLGMLGLGVSMWPYVVPHEVTIWDAAAPERSQIFMLVGVAITMPLILAYTGRAYWVFRGKVGSEGYH